jgi:hypothetical protein
VKVLKLAATLTKAYTSTVLYVFIHTCQQKPKSSGYPVPVKENFFFKKPVHVFIY